MKKFLLIISLVFLCVISLQANEEKAIKHTLLKYNYGIIKMGKSGETQFFRSFVEKDAAMKLQVWFESWKFSNLTYIANINDFIFGDIKFNEYNATISTMENWTFSYVNLATKEIALEPVNMLYKMNYTLANNNGNWVIIDVKHIEEKVIENNVTHKPTLDAKEPEELLVSPQSSQR